MNKVSRSITRRKSGQETRHGLGNILRSSVETFIDARIVRRITDGSFVAEIIQENIGDLA